MKVCTKCKEEKELTEFYKNKISIDGLRTDCKNCNNNFKKEYCKKNIIKIKQKSSEYYENNKKEIIKRNYNYTKKRKLIDPLFKLRHNISSLIYNKFNQKNGYTKKSKTSEYLGCSFKEFKMHLEKQFTKGMNWQNQGEWHLDHIYPVSLAKDEKELIKLNHYTNFQPLWAFDNLTKGKKIIEKQLILI